jgi:hypothetical protein
MKTTKLLPTNTTPAMLELYKLLLKSEKFLNWKPESADSNRDGAGPLSLSDLEESAVSVDEKHYSPDELATLWGVSVDSIRRIFRDEPGVLKMGSRSPKHKRQYLTLRIPESVAERVHTRLSA